MEKQQKSWRPAPASSASDSGCSTQSISTQSTSTQSTVTEDHAELDILDSLNLSDIPAHVRLKVLLLGSKDAGEDSLEQLSNVLQSRILVGHGETLFDLGQEDNGESMAFSKEQWDVALDRIRKAARMLKADCRMLMTRNVGGDEEVGPLHEKDKGLSGKMMIRKAPETVEDVIETRIAVVGNGRLAAVLRDQC